MPKSEADKAAKAARKAAEAEAAAAAQAAADKAARKAAKAEGKAKSKADDDDDPFATAGSGGDLFRAKDWPDELVLFYPHRIDTNVSTAYGTEPEVPVGKVIVLNAAKPSEPKAVFPSSPVFGKALLNALRPAFDASKPTAGLLHSATFKNGDGWVIDDDPKARKVAKAYIDSVNPLA